MKKLIIILAFLFPLPMVAQLAPLQGFCTQGGHPSKVSGLSATNAQQVVIPSCTVTVYLTGTLTKATIFADGSSTPLVNPFTATTASAPFPGQWIFFATTGVGYDVVLSGGISPNTYSTPFTLTDVFTGGGGGGGGGSPAPPSFAVQIANSSVSGFAADSKININVATHTLTSQVDNGTNNTDSLNTGNNGIATTFAQSQCATGACFGMVPATSVSSEGQGTYENAIQYFGGPVYTGTIPLPDGSAFMDYRPGTRGFFGINQIAGNLNFQQNTYWRNWNQQSTAQAPEYVNEMSQQILTCCGKNNDIFPTGLWTVDHLLWKQSIGFTKGIKDVALFKDNAYAPGDVVNGEFWNVTDGGCYTAGDECSENLRLSSTQDSVMSWGIVTSGGGVGTNQIVIASPQGVGFGEQRFVLDTSQAATTCTVTSVNAIGSLPTNPPTWTCAESQTISTQWAHVVGLTLASITASGGPTATVTTTIPNNFQAGDWYWMEGVSNPVFNFASTQIVQIINSNTFTIPNFWGTASGTGGHINDIQNTPQLFRADTTDMPIAVAIDGGSVQFAANDYVAVADQIYGECGKISSVMAPSGGVQQMRVGLRYQHGNSPTSATLVVKGTSSCKIADADALHFANGTSQPLWTGDYFVVGSRSANELIYASYYAGNWTQMPVDNAIFTTRTITPGTLTRTSNVTSITITDGVLGQSGGGSGTFNGLSGLIVSGCSDSSFNTTTGVVTETYTSYPTATLTWANSGSNGTTTCTNNIALGKNTIHIYPGAEVGSVVNPITHANDGTLVLAPSPWTVSNGDTIVSPHGSQIVGIHESAGHQSFTQTTLSARASDYIEQINDQPTPPGFRAHSVYYNTNPNLFFGGGGTKARDAIYTDFINPQAPWHGMFHMDSVPDGYIFRVEGCPYKVGGGTDCTQPFTYNTFQLTGAGNGFYQDAWTVNTNTIVRTVGNGATTSNMTQNANSLSYDKTLFIGDIKYTDGHLELAEQFGVPGNLFVGSDIGYGGVGNIMVDESWLFGMPTPSSFPNYATVMWWDQTTVWPEFNPGNTSNYTFLGVLASSPATAGRIAAFGTAGKTLVNSGATVDSSGNIGALSVIIGGNPAPVINTGAPTPGQAMCFKSVGPPIVLGTCSTGVSGSGACTCI